MPRNNFRDDVSVLSNDRFFSRSGSQSRARSGAVLSSSQSVTSASASRPRSSGRGGFMRKRNPFRSFRVSGRVSGPDDISVSDSLCSGVLRDLDSTLGGTGRSASSVLGDWRPSASSVAPSSSLVGAGRSTPSATLAPKAPLPGGVADFNAEFGRKASDNSSLSNGFSHSLTSGDDRHSIEAMSVVDQVADDSIKREARKERVREKLDKYKRDQKHLKKSCAALEQQLAHTTEKLREVDSRAAFKIDSLESELRETRVGMERVAKQSTKEVTDQSDCIKTLGKKLIRQAHVIKRQKDAVEQYKIQLEAMQEEMAMQDERDVRRDDEYSQLMEKYESVKEQKIQMQNLLQENIEEMMDLKSDTEKDAKCIMDLEFNLQQKDATLDRVAKDVSEKSSKICQLEEELEGKNREIDISNTNLKESEAKVGAMKEDLENMSTELDSNIRELEELRCDYTALKASSSVPTAAEVRGDRDVEQGGDGNDTEDSTPDLAEQRPSVFVGLGGGVGLGMDGNNDNDANLNMADRRPSSLFGGLGGGGDGNNTINNRSDRRPASFFGFQRPGVADTAEVETFEAELQAKDATIQTLDETVKEHEETIKTLRSDIVKMSSTFKQDSYLKRKEIAKLKQMNAEYALKLRALEKAFKSVNATENISRPSSSSLNLGHTMHSTVSSTRLGVSTMHSGSRHGRSMHSVGSTASSKEEKAAAVKARLGGLAPYEFPSAEQLRIKDSQVVVEANFFDGSDQASEDGRKGELPEEC